MFLNVAAPSADAELLILNTDVPPDWISIDLPVEVLFTNKLVPVPELVIFMPLPPDIVASIALPVPEFEMLITFPVAEAYCWLRFSKIEESIQLPLVTTQLLLRLARLPFIVIGGVGALKIRPLFAVGDPGHVPDAPVLLVT